MLESSQPPQTGWSDRLRRNPATFSSRRNRDSTRQLTLALLSGHLGPFLSGFRETDGDRLLSTLGLSRFAAPLFPPLRLADGLLDLPFGSRPVPGHGVLPANRQPLTAATAGAKKLRLTEALVAARDSQTA